jgi:hypothetical protein
MRHEFLDRAAFWVSGFLRISGFELRIYLIPQIYPSRRRLGKLLHGVPYVLKLAVSRCRWAPSGTIKLDLTDYETAQPD